MDILLIRSSGHSQLGASVSGLFGKIDCPIGRKELLCFSVGLTFEFSKQFISRSCSLSRGQDQETDRLMFQSANVIVVHMQINLP